MNKHDLENIISKYINKSKINTIKQPVSFSKTKLSYKSLAPSLGEDYMSILQEIGFKKSEIHKLIKSKCIHPPKK